MEIATFINGMATFVILIAVVFIMKGMTIHTSDKLEANKMYSLGVVSLIVAISVMFCSSYIKQYVTPKEIEEQRSEYTIYLDGEEVDPEKIDLSLYKVKYDDEKGIAYATTQTQRSTEQEFITWMIK